MAWIAAAIVGSSLVNGIVQSNAADSAAGAQTAASEAGIAEQRRQFDALQKLLSPFVNAGTGALSAQQDLLGVNGPEAQQKAIDALKTSPSFTSAQKLGEQSILANASATGGLRGGNTQAALAQFSPQLLAQAINDQYGRLGGMTSLGQNAAAGVGNAGMQTGTNVANLLSQMGAAQAGGALAQGNAFAGMTNGLARGFGVWSGLPGNSGGFGNVSGSDLFGWKGSGGF